MVKSPYMDNYLESRKLFIELCENYKIDKPNFIGITPFEKDFIKIDEVCFTIDMNKEPNEYAKVVFIKYLVCLLNESEIDDIKKSEILSVLPELLPKVLDKKEINNKDFLCNFCGIKILKYFSALGV